MTAATKLTKAQQRHLRELVGPKGTTLYWRPSGSGEARCAEKLQGLGLLGGSALTYSDAYYLTDRGMEIARELLAEAQR